MTYAPQRWTRLRRAAVDNPSEIVLFAEHLGAPQTDKSSRLRFVDIGRSIVHKQCINVARLRRAARRCGRVPYPGSYGAVDTPIQWRSMNAGMEATEALVVIRDLEV